ncbi:DUF6279 family lipoprotein [bacterium]|nr:DUF6279 family lipoprotein [bacterium]
MFKTSKFYLLLALLFIGGCSSTTFVYNRLDFLLPWYLDDYVELDRAQETFLDAQLQPFLAWHRSEELPRYTQILDDITRRLDGPLTGQDVAAISLEFEQAWLRLEGRSLEWLLALGERLTEDQVQQFLDELWKQQEKYQKKYLERSDREYREDSYDSLVDSVQDYLGRLSKPQKQLLETASGELLRSDATWLRERAAWLQRLGVMMRREPGWQQAIRDAVQQRSETVSVDYVELYEHNLAVIHSALAQVLNSRSEKQDQRLRKKLTNLREDLQVLAAQAEPALNPAATNP